MSREKMMRRMYICVIRLQYLRDERETEEDWRENIFRREWEWLHLLVHNWKVGYYNAGQTTFLREKNSVDQKGVF